MMQVQKPYFFENDITTVYLLNLPGELCSAGALEEKFMLWQNFGKVKISILKSRDEMEELKSSEKKENNNMNKNKNKKKEEKFFSGQRGQATFEFSSVQNAHFFMQSYCPVESSVEVGNERVFFCFGDRNTPNCFFVFEDIRDLEQDLSFNLYGENNFCQAKFEGLEEKDQDWWYRSYVKEFLFAEYWQMPVEGVNYFYDYYFEQFLLKEKMRGKDREEAREEKARAQLEILKKLLIKSTREQLFKDMMDNVKPRFCTNRQLFCKFFAWNCKEIKEHEEICQLNHVKCEICGRNYYGISSANHFKLQCRGKFEEKLNQLLDKQKTEEQGQKHYKIYVSQMLVVENFPKNRYSFDVKKFFENLAPIENFSIQPPKVGNQPIFCAKYSSIEDAIYVHQQINGISINQQQQRLDIQFHKTKEQLELSRVHVVGIETLNVQILKQYFENLQEGVTMVKILENRNKDNTCSVEYNYPYQAQYLVNNHSKMYDQQIGRKIKIRKYNLHMQEQKSLENSSEGTPKKKVEVDIDTQPSSSYNNSSEKYTEQEQKNNQQQQVKENGLKQQEEKMQQQQQEIKQKEEEDVEVQDSESDLSKEKCDKIIENEKRKNSENIKKGCQNTNNNNINNKYLEQNDPVLAELREKQELEKEDRNRNYVLMKNYQNANSFDVKYSSLFALDRVRKNIYFQCVQLYLENWTIKSTIKKYSKYNDFMAWYMSYMQQQYMTFNLQYINYEQVQYVFFCNNQQNYNGFNGCQNYPQSQSQQNQYQFQRNTNDQVGFRQQQQTNISSRNQQRRQNNNTNIINNNGIQQIRGQQIKKQSQQQQQQNKDEKNKKIQQQQLNNNDFLQQLDLNKIQQNKQK